MVDKKRTYNKLASAVIPAYNEAARIKKVLSILGSVKNIGEIIVVDDGSTDDLETEVSKFPGVIYLKNKKNLGKSATLDQGVKKAKNDTLLFCDADLKGLREGDIEDIIAPVLSGEKDMYIGVMANKFNSAVSNNKRISRSFFIAGLRSLKKERWEKLPSFYKKRFRVEIGLTYYISRYGHGWGYSCFNYSQSKKESKHGIKKGLVLRFWMIYDLILAYLAAKVIGEIAFFIKKLFKLL